MFLDTTVIVELMRGETQRIESIMPHIENELLFISVIQLGEVNDWCLTNCTDPAARISQLKKIVVTIPMNEAISLEASELKHMMRARKIVKFSLLDGIILASARYIGQTLLTFDQDFRKSDGAIILR